MCTTTSSHASPHSHCLSAQVRQSSNTCRKISLAQIGLREERQVELHSFLGAGGGFLGGSGPLSRGLKTEGEVVGRVFSLRVSLLQAYLSVPVKLKEVQDKDAILRGSRDLNPGFLYRVGECPR